MKSYQEKDLKYIWHPCSQMKDYEEFPSVIVERGKGAYVYDLNGKSYMDAVSSWWVNLFGHSNERINRAIKNQMDNIEHVIFANFSHKSAIDFAERIVKISPEGLNKVFFSDNGSSAIEIALKMSFHSHMLRGKADKKRFVALSSAYHGETLGALSVGGLDLYSEVYKPMLLNTFRIENPDCYRCKYNKHRDSCKAECFEDMEKVIVENHREITAVIVEPMVQGAAGMKMYSPAYLKKLRKICDEYDIHLIADEIAVGFGRTGKMFACEHAEISPDFMAISKGVSGGYMAMSAVLTTDEIYDAFYADYSEARAFIHSHTYSGNALACAAACEVLDIFEEEDILKKNEVKSKKIKELALKRVKGNPYIGEYRQLGMIGAIELVEDKVSKKQFDWKKRVGYDIYKIAMSKGLVLRPIANVLYFMPPYIIDDKDIDFMVNTAFDSIEEYFRK
ncbi:adenosylmethionine--8-amino-7-oxononanoate transaminase [Oceanirhabdus seepicola]|uniref:Adenosylmethionine-8-amino-7-oxononanoate aminotransferase n=1 Tax=Oceanirhabdus seepicola TaxID=2828781 RepID=A0A9J6P6T0_9CLOT|nr:adenosylmethionine--8-amino-7-oxononanoate transaminase [Oceanirhabdus seepicola]MCM1992562.1 adenosylmethionine--8-amino-7-oxononanoate transaminase [Oceanirhabdus seepicola]